LLEWQIRRLVTALPNVELWDQCAVEELAWTPDRQQVTGVVLTRRATGERLTYRADLVIDATGRGSATPKWLEAAGYGAPREEVVRVDMSYASCVFDCLPGDPVDYKALMIDAVAPSPGRGGIAMEIEEGRWIAGIMGRGGDHPPCDHAGFLEFARSLPAPDLYQLIRRLKPLSDPIPYRYPNSLRRHYEGMNRLPAGLLVLGDAVCSFNPIYGQGMSSAALQAVVLDELLQGAQGVQGPLGEGFSHAYFRRAATIVDTPWRLAVGQDFRFPDTKGQAAPGTALINRYVRQVERATHHDTEVYKAFLLVTALIKTPESLMRPRIMWRVLRPRWGRTGKVATPSMAGALLQD
jgi:2-polyprenyl-6-methoxyphenol hydroxylase-like FAD-dependent oxidoreductase